MSAGTTPWPLVGTSVRRTMRQPLGRLPLHDAIGHGVGVLLVAIAEGPDAVGEGHASLLLDDVDGRVRGRVQVGCAAERDAVAAGVAVGALGLVRGGRGGAGVRRDAAHVVAAERAPDAAEVGQRSGATRGPRGRGGVHVGVRGALAVALDGT